MRNLALAALSVCCFLTVNGCRMVCKDGHGPVRAEIRDVSGFTSLHVNIPAEVTVVQGDDYQVQVEAEDNLHDEIRLSTSGHRLKITSKTCLKPNMKIHVRVTMPELEELVLNGTGNIVVPDTFRVDELDLVINGAGNIDCSLIAARVESAIHGSGNIRLTGSANSHEVRIAGSGDIQAMNMPCNTSDIRVTGSGDVFVYTIKDLEIRITGSGDVFYKGKPRVSTKINGSGKAVDKN
jgi:hypothetical protein